MNDSRIYATQLLKLYYKTFSYPFTHHQINSYDQFLSTDIPAIIKANNPILILQDPIGSSGQYTYKTEIFIGGLNGDKFYIGTPSLELKTDSVVRILYPNEARLRNLTYASTVSVDIVIRVTFTTSTGTSVVLLDSKDPKYEYLGAVPFFQIPIMLHSRYCLLHAKPNLFLKNIGECPYDYGGYFIIDGSEKVLITHQEQSFNTLYISKQPRDKKVEVYASIQCLNPISKEVKRVGFGYLRMSNVLRVSIPFVRKAIPVFILFRALGVQSDQDILRLLCPDENDIEAKVLEPLLHESMLEAHPILDTYSAIQYIRVFTKGFSEAHVYDILYNQLFIHIENKPMHKAAYLADCVLKILRVKADYDTDTDKDDIRNQRCLTSGILTRMLFQGIYTQWLKAMSRSLDQEYKYNVGIYSGSKFLDIFLPGNVNTLFQLSFITEGLNRGFKGKWSSGAAVGEEKTGVLQPLSRLSYLDFLSHCRRVVLDFDTGMKLQGPRRLHTTQFGYFCTSETPGGGSIGITKNFSVLTAVSLSLDPRPFSTWLFKMGTYLINDLTPLMMKVAVPIYINSGIVGYTIKPNQLVSVCKLLKHTGCLPAYSSIGFNIRERRVFFYFDEGRPVRPLVHISNGTYPYEAIRKVKSWRDLVYGTFEATADLDITSTVFRDPLKEVMNPLFDDYIKLLTTVKGIIEYVDPYESNEAYIAMYPEQIVSETTHVEIHPSTMVGLLTSMIPFPNHNQSPRNQLSCSQSKQGISIFSTNYPNRYDNQTHVLCYGEAPLVRTLYYDYAADGNIGYGHNLILAMGCFTGYNQEDGIVMNADSIQRGLFRNITYRSYEVFEEDDPHAKTKTRISNPNSIPAWTRLKPGLDYRKLDERGIIKKGEAVDETTVLVGRYIQSQSGEMNDASITAQVWTSGIVEEVAITVNNMGLALVKIRVIHDRIPELGDKFCLTPDHDVLTKRGWVSIQSVNLEDEVAQLNRNTGCMEYVKPNEIYVFDHTGHMYEVESQGVSLKTTLNHRMWVKGRNEKSYSLIEASNVLNKRVKYQSAAAINNTEKDIIINDYKFNVGIIADNWLRFFGLWIAEGWTYIKEKDYIARVEFAAYKDKVYNSLVKSCQTLKWNYSYNEKSNKFYVNEKQIALYLDNLSDGAINKRLPSWVFNLSMQQSKLLIASLCIGNGYESKTSLHYYTSSLGLKDDIQQLCQHAGYTSYSKIRYKKGWISPILNKEGKEFKANSDAWDIGIRKIRLNPTMNHSHVHKQNGQKESIVDYNGKVYCLSVSSEVFLVRRNGRIVFTGNSNRHGQKGTIGMLIPGRDMPRTASGIVPDMMMNPHAIPSRMTIAQLLESLLGKSACLAGFIGDATAFMNESGIEKSIGDVLQNQFGLHPYGEELFYDGTTGKMIPSTIFVGNVYTMRLKHMVEDKWNARGLGRREQRTHQPTGGRGNQGGLRIGEMERDALIGHGISTFLQESLMKRSDGSVLYVCNGCGTVPISNPKEGHTICSLCDGPLQYIGDSASNFEVLPTTKRSSTSFSHIEIPYSLEILNKELGTYMNMFIRYLTTKDVAHLRKTPLQGLNQAEVDELLHAVLPEHVYATVPEPQSEDSKDIIQPVLDTLPVIDKDLEEDSVFPTLTVSEAKNNLESTGDLPYIQGPMPVEPVEFILETPSKEPMMSQQQYQQSQVPMMSEQQYQQSQVPMMSQQEYQQSQEPYQLSQQPQMTQQLYQPQTYQQPYQPQQPPTLVVDTSTDAMAADGFMPKSILKRPNSPSRFNKPKTSFTISKMDSTESSSTNVPKTVNIIKQE